MILKVKDDVGPLVAQLDELLQRRLTQPQRRAIEQEKLAILSGARAERDAAYDIDFHFKDSKNWAVLHDLRLEFNGRVAQIDHLLLWSGLDVYVVESKNFRQKVRIQDGHWEVIRHNHWTGIPSPVAQNERHITVLRDLISSSPWAPTFLGTVRQPIRYVNVVAVPSECTVHGEDQDVMVLSIDRLVKTVRKDRAGLLSASALSGISSAKLCDLGLNLLDCHRPATFDFAAKFGLDREPRPSPPVRTNPQPAAALCASCGAALSDAEVRFCGMNKSRFAGQLLCRQCQGLAPKSAAKPAAGNPVAVPVAHPPEPTQAPASSGPRCADCGAGVEARVVAFCRFNTRRFAGKTVCRTCQPRYSPVPA